MCNTSNTSSSQHHVSFMLLIYFIDYYYVNSFYIQYLNISYDRLVYL